jgi:ribosome-associated protein
VDFVIHVFLAERRAFYDIERLRKSARPMTPAEFDAELKAKLSEKTRAVRSKSAPKAKVQARPAATAKKTARATAAKRKPAAKKSAPRKPGAKKAKRSR